MVTMRLRQVIIVGVATLATLPLAGCTDYADYDERLDYLRKVAQRGADTHALIVSQEAAIDKARCERAHGGLNLTVEAPGVDGSVDERQAWRDQIKEFFVDSCISGKPKPVPGDPVPPTAPSLTPQSPAPAST